MTTTYTRPNYARTHTVPHHVLTNQMDRARRMEEDARQLHDRLAYEAGYERVRVHLVRPGDIIESATTHNAYTVDTITQKVDPSGIGEWWEVKFTGADGESTYDEGQFVTRYLNHDETSEAF